MCIRDRAHSTGHIPCRQDGADAQQGALRPLTGQQRLCRVPLAEVGLAAVQSFALTAFVTDRYLGLLKEAFKSVLGFDVDITLVVPSTPPHEVVLAQQYEACLLYTSRCV